MRIVEDISAIQAERFDVCVVGAGPVGLSLATDLGRRNRSVLVLEAGGLKPTPNSEWVVATTTNSNHVPLDHALARGFGGTSALWGGRCIPLDEADFSDFGAARGRAWPIGESELSPFNARAAQYLGCGAGVFRTKPDSADERLLACGVDISCLERWCAEPFTPRHLDRQPGSNRVTVALNAEVQRLGVRSGQGRIDGIVLRNTGRLQPINASQYVIAAGGVGNAKILLSTQSAKEIDFGPSLGRYYMGHVSGSVGKIVFKSLTYALKFSYNLEVGSSSRRLLTLTPEIRQNNDIPNIYFYPSNPMLSDASHGSGLLSALYLSLRLPLLGRRLISEGIRSAQLERKSSIFAHLSNILLQPLQTIFGLSNVLRQRIFEGRKKPLLFLPSRSGEYDLHYHAEQIPHLGSGFSLGLDADGNEVLQDLNLEFLEDDFAGVERAHAQLAAAMKNSDVGELRVVGSAQSVRRMIADQAKGGFHQIGLTRMGETPEDGVVDRNCRAFAADNLFVAGASVFRTSGRANPTFSAVALGLRLAEHLDRQLSQL